jgi:hypothetical protein
VALREPETVASRAERDLLEEVLERLRKIERLLGSLRGEVPHDLGEYLSTSMGHRNWTRVEHAWSGLTRSQKTLLCELAASCSEGVCDASIAKKYPLKDLLALLWSTLIAGNEEGDLLLDEITLEYVRRKTEPAKV